MNTPLLTSGISADFSAAFAEMRLRLINMSRYPGQLVLEIFLPILFAAMPIFLSQAIPGSDVAANFESNTGTRNYVAYLLIGSNIYILVTRAFWDIAYWLRFEQQVGTLEAIYMTPTNTLVLVCGVAMYSAVRGVGATIIAYFLGCLLFWINPFQGDLLLVFVFLLVGLIPIYAMALLFGALVIKIKESNALVALMQWGISFIMGVYYPLKMLPEFVQGFALLFPPTWVVNGVRSSLLGVGFFLENWYFDLAVLWTFMMITPLFSIWVFRRVEDNTRRNQGVGQF